MIGVPYLGSKRFIAKAIVDYILQTNPNAKYVWDLFGGGGAISFEFLQRKQIKQVFYNEVNTGVVELLKKIKDEGVTEEFYRWISREEFHAHKSDESWFGGLLLTCWSFGNDQRSYLYGKYIEEEKRLLHEIVVNRCDVSRQKLKELKGFYVDDELLKEEDLQERRKKVMLSVKKFFKNRRISLEHLEIGQQLPHLERLQQLERIQRLQPLQNLKISNKSYLDVFITTPKDKTIIYLDPPYQNTFQYQKNICHKELMDYIKNSPYKIYVSSYEFVLPAFWSISKRCSLSPTARDKVVTEKLFCNHEEAIKTTLF